jgi:hypothetical protein
MQGETSPIADRLGDSRSKAYSLAGEIHVSTMVAPKPLHEFETLKRKAIEAASDTSDAYIQNWIRFVIGWDEFHRGLITDARRSAHELMQVGRLLRDPRSTGFGLALLTWIALVSDSFAEALEYSEQSLAVAVTPFDLGLATNGKGCGLVLLRQAEEGAKLLEEHRRRCVADGYLYGLAGIDGIIAVSKVFQGNIGEGIHLIQEAILRQEKDGYRDAADWHRGVLAEVYLQIISGNEKLPFLTLVKNLPIILNVMVTASSRIHALLAVALQNPHFHPAGHHIGRAHMTFGLLYKAREKPVHAVQHLSEARRILSQFGQTPMLARVDAALASLQQ